MSSFGYNLNWSYHLVTSNLPLTPSTAVSNNFTINFYPKWYDSITLDWSVPSDWGTVKFNVYHSLSLGGPYFKLNSTPLTNPYYKDKSDRAFSKYRDSYYIVEAVFPSGQTVQSPPSTSGDYGNSWVTLRQNEISRREWLILRKFVGIETYLFRKKSTGPRCPHCWNADSKRVMNDKCPYCYGTSWEGGYWDPIQTFVQYEATPNDAVSTYSGIVEPNQIRAWTINVPTMTDFDILFRKPDFRIYRIERIEPTELRTNVVRQGLVLAELSKESVEFLLQDKIT